MNNRVLVTICSYGECVLPVITSVQPSLGARDCAGMIGGDPVVCVCDLGTRAALCMRLWGVCDSVDVIQRLSP